MKCLRCGNCDDKYFYLGLKGYYCRKCIIFKRFLLDEQISIKDYSIKDDAYDFEVDFLLTDKQKEIGNKLVEYVNEGNNVILNAVCGAGKTEMLLAVISDFLKKKLHVGFAIPRKEVVLELSLRFQKYFNKAKVVKVCQGYNDEPYGDLIICTTHQLYRYYKFFDLLIIDEVDAFPFKDNQLLKEIAKNSCKKTLIYASATVDLEMKKLLKKDNWKILFLQQRPHKKPLIIPKNKFFIGHLKLFYLYYFLKFKTSYCLIFCPTIKICIELTKIFKFLKFNCDYLTSKSINKQDVVARFYKKDLNFLFTTTILERGVSFKDVDVVVYEADNPVFDCSSLIQMVGRVGRNYNNPYGKAIYLSNFINYDIRQSIKQLKRANKSLLEYN